jgi:hypothetical protein
LRPAGSPVPVPICKPCRPQPWLTRLIRVSPSSGNWRVWPGATIGLSLYQGGTPGRHRVAVSWGCALDGRKAHSEIRAFVLTPLP